MDRARNARKILSYVAIARTIWGGEFLGRSRMIGAAVKRIPDWARSQDLAKASRDLAGMQNKLIRDCFNMDVKIIWQAILEDVPPLKMTIARVFEDLRNSLPSF